MGLFEKVFTKKEATKTAKTFFQELNGYTPTWTTWGGQLYESELVRSAIDAKARHASKLQFFVSGPAKPDVQARLKKQPNSYQTWSQFFYRVSTILDMQGTCFIVPVWDKLNNIVGLVTFNPKSWALVRVNDENEPWLRFYFDAGRVASARLSEVGILTRFQYQDDFFGTRNNALRETMELIDIQNQGITEAVKSSATFRFMAKVTNFAMSEDLEKERNRFVNSNMKDGGGLLLFPNTYNDIQQIKSTPYTVDSAQRGLIQNNVYNYFGVNENILQNKASVDEMDAFFNGSIEPFEIQLSDVLTKLLFTENERARGSRVDILANRLQYMNVGSKIAIAKELGDRGFITVNEVRELFNYPALPAEIGDKMPIRGEFYFVGDEKTEETEDED